MNIKELMVLTGSSLYVGIDVNNNVYVRFNGCEIKQNGCLAGVCGRGNTLGMAIFDYVNSIRNKTLVFDAMGKNRKEFIVPESLEDEL